MYRLIKFGAALPKFRYCGSLLKTECLTKISCYARTNMTRTSDVMENRLKARDMIPESFRIIYRGGMDLYVHLAHQSSVILSVLGACVLYRTFMIEDEPIEFPVKTPVKLIGIQNYTQLFIMNATFFVMMFGMRQISSKYVVRMYHNPATDTYRAVKMGFLPGAIRFVDFQAGTLQRRTNQSFIPWLNFVYNANGTKIMFFEGGFKTSADFNKMFKD